MGYTKFQSGQQYNNLTLVRLESKIDNIYKWRCRCICGNETIVRTAHLSSGHTKSCGCQKTLKNNAKDLTGQKFGRLIVLQRDFSERSNIKRAYWLCQCDCGKQKIILGKNLLNGSIRSCTCLLVETNAKRCGILSASWRHDLSPEERSIAKNRLLVDGYDKWRKLVKIRDRCCQVCASTKELEAHHIIPWQSNKELRTDPGNGVCLCRKCHLLFHSKYGKNNNSAAQLSEFKQSFLLQPS